VGVGVEGRGVSMVGFEGGVGGGRRAVRGEVREKNV